MDDKHPCVIGVGLESVEDVGAFVQGHITTDYFCLDALGIEFVCQDSDHTLKRHKHQNLLACLLDNFSQYGIAVLDVKLNCLPCVGVHRTTRYLQEFAHVHGSID